MIVVSDTSVINYLVQINLADLPHRLYGEICIPEQVLAELDHDGALPAVKNFIAAKPTWLTIKTMDSIATGLEDLDIGKAAAISLVLSLHCPLLVDGTAARARTKQLGLTAFGVLDILLDAAAQNMINFAESLQRLRRTNFYISDELAESLTQQANRK